MTDEALLTLIRADKNLRELADAGSDDAVAQAVTATLPPAVVLSVPLILKAVPETLLAITKGASPLAEMEVIASRVRAQDVAGLAIWADTLHMLGKMPDAEYKAAAEMLSQVGPQDKVDHTQVSRVLNSVRPVDEKDGAVRALPITWE